MLVIILIYILYFVVWIFITIFVENDKSMFITKQKQIYVVNKILEELDKSSSYTLDIYNKTYTFKYPSAQSNYSSRALQIAFYFKDDILKKVSIERDTGSIYIERDDNLVKYFDLLENAMTSRMDYIDDIKFRIIFPEYNLNQERDERLAIILGDEEPKEDKKDKKGFFSKLFQKNNNV